MEEVDEAVPERWSSQSVEDLTSRFLNAGCPSFARELAASELSEDLPQYSQYLLLRGFWKELLGAREQCLDSVGRMPGGEALLAAHRQDLSWQFSNRIGSLVWGLLGLLDNPELHRVESDDPVWRISEVFDGVPSGRQLSGLHEMFPDFHPGGASAAEEEGWL